MSNSEGNRLLVLVIDEDDDLGFKAGVKSPVVGRTENYDAALKLIMADPEDADANAMFAAISLYDELLKNPVNELEIVTITGKKGGGIESDIKIGRELDSVLSQYPADSCIIVTDGPLPQSILSIVASRIKIDSVKTIVVKQSQSVEQTWLLLGRYLKMAIFDVEYAKYILGIPGILLFIVGILYSFNLLNLPIILSIIGLAFLIRGFGIDSAIVSFSRRIYGFTERPLVGQIRVFTSVAAIILIISAFSFGIGEVVSYITRYLPNAPPVSEQPEFWLSRFGLLSGILLVNSVDLLTVAALILAAYNIFYYFYLRSPKLWRMVQATVVILFLWALLKALGEFLRTSEIQYLVQLSFIAIIGFATLATSFILIRSIRSRFPLAAKKGR
jgi:putative membrane protein